MRRLRHEARGALRLSPWLLLSLALVLALWQADTAALAGLFQSPATETPTLPPTNTPAVTPTLEPSATLPPLASETPALPPTETPTAALSDTPTATATPAETLPAGEETLTPSPTPAGGEESTPAAGEEDRERYPSGESGLNFEWGMLFDAVALALSYSWLCCGGLIVLGVPLFFLVLWVASTVRRQRTE